MTRVAYSLTTKLIVLFGFLSSVFLPVRSEGAVVEPLHAVLDCQTQPEKSCIESIALVDEDGTRRVAKLTGRTTYETRTYAPESVLSATWEEYSIEGVRFSGKAQGAFIPRVFFFPQGNRDCFYNPCVEGGEYFELAMAPTWLDGPPSNVPLTLPYRKSNLACGDKANPGYCYEPHRFDTKSTFEFTIRMPADFQTITSTGRGIQDFSLREEGLLANRNGEVFKRVTIRAKPIPFSNYGFSAPNIDEYADYETDAFVFWLWGETDVRVRDFESCSKIPKLSVVSNIFYASFPIWDEKEQSIYVNVAGPHFRSDGTINYGNIQVRVSRMLADCLWGIDIGRSVGAKVSITYENPDEPQTQVVSSRVIDDEYLLTISGMHFSSPTVRVKLEQQKDGATGQPSDIASSSTEPQEAFGDTKAKQGRKERMKRITCVKGSQVKKMAPSKARCPKGFKRS